jgi:ClpP class serine protease
MAAASNLAAEELASKNRELKEENAELRKKIDAQSRNFVAVVKERDNMRQEYQTHSAVAAAPPCPPPIMVYVDDPTEVP